MNHYYSSGSGRFYKTESGACLGEIWRQGIAEPCREGRYTEAILSVPLSISLAALTLVYPIPRELILEANVKKIYPVHEPIR
jgi:hypothetical protein